MKLIFRVSLLIWFFMPYNGIAQITLIPDAAFEQFLIDEGVDTDGALNGQVFTVDIEDETILSMEFNVNIFNFIYDLTGVEDFTNLEVLHIRQMPISSLNLSQNVNLLILELDDLALNELIVSSNINLERISLSLNSAGDMFSGDISEIDLSNNLLLEHANLGDSFIEIDLTNNVNLQTVRLQFLPDLTFANLKNGNNSKISFVAINDNPNLECLEVDDPLAVIAGTDPPYDSWVIFGNNPSMIITDDCGLGVQEYLSAQIKLYPNPTVDNVFIEVLNGLTIESIEVHNVSGKLLLLQNNNVTQVDVSNLAKGIYFISLNTEKGTLVEKIIKK